MRPGGFASSAAGGGVLARDFPGKKAVFCLPKQGKKGRFPRLKKAAPACVRSSRGSGSERLSGRSL